MTAIEMAATFAKAVNCLLVENSPYTMYAAHKCVDEYNSFYLSTCGPVLEIKAHGSTLEKYYCGVGTGYVAFLRHVGEA